MMNRPIRRVPFLCVSPALAILIASVMSAPAWSVTIPTMPVGNAGNAPDMTVMITDGTSGYGAVAYDYRIGTTEVTNAQYIAFLNAKDPTGANALALYNGNMTSDARGGIAFTAGNPNGSKYSDKLNMGDKPVNFVSWYDAIRFANWLHNGQGSGDTETGAYTLGQLGAGGVPINGSSITRNVGVATWWLASEDEWYKAAYHQPTAQGGDSDNYWLYPTASNTAPTIATANSVGDISNPGANVANYDLGADWNSQNGNGTTVGSAGPLSESYYGTADQGGNFGEWNEALIGGSFRGVRGGSFDLNAGLLQSWYRDSHNPVLEGNGLGFRVATVPEPPTFALAGLAILGCALTLWRRRKH